MGFGWMRTQSPYCDGSIIALVMLSVWVCPLDMYVLQVRLWVVKQLAAQLQPLLLSLVKANDSAPGEPYRYASNDDLVHWL